MSVSKKGIPFNKPTKDVGMCFKANYVINGLSEGVIEKIGFNDYYKNPKRLGKQIEYLELSDYLWNHRVNAKVYLYVECLLGQRGYNGVKAANLYVEATWMDLDTKTYHKQTSNMSQGEYEQFVKMLNLTYLEN